MCFEYLDELRTFVGVAAVDDVVEDRRAMEIDNQQSELTLIITRPKVARKGVFAFTLSPLYASVYLF